MVVVVVVAAISAVAAGDSLNMRLVGNWPFGASYAVAADPGRSIVFCGMGGGVLPVDGSDPGGPVQLSDAIRTAGIVTGLEYRDNLLYVAAGTAGLEVWDVTDPQSPARLGRCAARGQVRRVRLCGSLALVADHDSGLSVVDVSNPADPRELGFCGEPFRAMDVAVQDSLAYVADYNDVVAISFSDPASPVVVGRLHSYNRARSVAVRDTLALVGEYEHGLQVFSVADPASPRWLGEFDETGAPVRIVADGSTVYAVDGADDGGLWVLDLSDPANPRELGHCALAGGFGADLVVAGSAVFVADEQAGVRFIDASQPVRPLEVGNTKPPAVALSLCVEGGLAYLATTTGLRLLDVSSPGSIVELGSCGTLGGMGTVVVSGGTALVSTWPAGDLAAVDVTDPVRPAELGRWDLPGEVSGIARRGDIAFVACEQGGLRVMDVSDPTSPVELSVYAPGQDIVDVAVPGDHLCLADGSALRVIDASDPGAPHEVGRCTTPGLLNRSVEARDGFAYVACEDAGLAVVDARDPSQPAVVGVCDTPGYACDVALFGTLVALADDNQGVQVVDVSVPSGPVPVGAYGERGTQPQAVAQADNLVFAVSEQAGLQVYDFYGSGLSDGRSAAVVANPARVSIVGRTLSLPAAGSVGSSVLLDASGRTVMMLRPGANDVSRLAPGVYFVRVDHGRAEPVVVVH
jgi:hypothetical protein